MGFFLLTFWIHKPSVQLHFNYEITWLVLLQSQQDNLTVRFFQLPLSLRNVSLEPNHGDQKILNFLFSYFDDLMSLKCMMIILLLIDRYLTLVISEVNVCFIYGHAVVCC